MALTKLIMECMDADIIRKVEMKTGKGSVGLPYQMWVTWSNYRGDLAYVDGRTESDLENNLLQELKAYKNRLIKESEQLNTITKLLLNTEKNEREAVD